jgi:hypothetical protein
MGIRRHRPRTDTGIGGSLVRSGAARNDADTTSYLCSTVSEEAVLCCLLKMAYEHA